MDIEGLRPVPPDLHQMKEDGLISTREMRRLANERLTNEAAKTKPETPIEKAIAKQAAVKQEPAKQAAGKVGQSHDKIPNRGTILVDIDSTLLDTVGDDLYNRLILDKNLTPDEQGAKYLDTMLSDPKYSQMKPNIPLINKLQVLSDAGYDLKLWTDRRTALQGVTESNLSWATDLISKITGQPDIELRLGKEGSIFSELIMGGIEGGNKKLEVPGNVKGIIDDAYKYQPGELVGIIDDAYKNLTPIDPKKSRDINLTGREKLGSVARVIKTEKSAERILSKGLSNPIVTEQQLEELKNRKRATAHQRSGAEQGPSAQQAAAKELTGPDSRNVRTDRSDRLLNQMLKARQNATAALEEATKQAVAARQPAAKQAPVPVDVERVIQGKGKAAAKELRGLELQQQQLEARQAATARREAEHRKRLSLSPEEAARERLLPHSDAALEHLAERKKTEKWQKQVRLELEGKSKPKLTLFKGGEDYEKTTSAKDKKTHKKVHKERFHREANIAPEELMSERAEAAQESKKIKEGLEQAKKKLAEQDLLTPEEKAAQRASERDLVGEHRERVKRGEALPEIEQLGQHTKRRREAQQAAAQQAAAEQVAVQKAAAREAAAQQAAAREAAAAEARAIEATNQQAASARTSSSSAVSPSSPRVPDSRSPRAENPLADTTDILRERQKSLRTRLQEVHRRSSSNPLTFFFDTEATDLGFSHRDKIIKGGKLVKYAARDGDRGTRSGSKPVIGGQTQSQRAVGTQILQFYGGTTEEIAKQENVFQRHMEVDIDVGIKKKLEKSLKFDWYEADGRTIKESFNAEQIDRIMNDSDGSLSADDRAARKAMGDPGGPQGKFHITDPKVLKDITASRLTNPTGGMFGLGVNLTKHTLNQVAGRTVFESKYGRPSSVQSEKFVQDFLNRMVKLQKDATGGIKPQVEAWNINYDLIKAAEQVDMYGKDLKIQFQDKMRSAKDVFKALFIGTDASSADYLIKAVDAADKIKEISFWRLINDNQYNIHSINHEEVVAALERGQTKAQIQDAGIEELRTSKTGVETKYIKRNTAIRKLSDDIGGGRGREALRQDFYDRIYEGEGPYSSADHTRHKQGRIGQIVDDAVTMTLKIRESYHSKDGNMIEALRRGSSLLRSQSQGVDIADRIWRPTARTSGIMGFGLGKDANFVEGTAKQMMHALDNSIVFDTLGGFSQGADGRTVATGQGGAIKSLVYAKKTYIETHAQSRLSENMQKFFKKIVEVDQIGGASHDASVDTRQMHAMAQEGGIFRDMHIHGNTTEMGEFNRLFAEAREAASIEAGIDRYMFDTDFAPQGRGASGTSGNILQEIIPEPQTIDNAGDFSSRGALNSTEPLASRPRGIKGRGGVLAGGILALAGLALIGNRNGGIKQPGSQYNSIEGMSPSGDPLIHSFGSGNDSFASQAITNLKYGTGYGSNTLRSSMLGYRGDRLRDILLGRSSFDDYTNSSEKGTLVHSVIEAEYLKRDIAQSSEHVVHSPELDVMGHVDLVLNSGVPLEIKSVEDFEALENLKSPKDAHVSQANFYAYALKQPYALIGYAARNDPKGKIKYFKVNTDIKRVRDDVEAVRRMMVDLRRQGHNTRNYSAYQAMKDARSRFTQNKYRQNAVGAGAGLPSGMIPSASWRQENKTHITNTRQFKSKSRIRDQGKHAALHGNNTLKYNARISHPNRSRQIA